MKKTLISKKFKKVISMMMILCFCLTFIPVAAFAVVDPLASDKEILISAIADLPQAERTAIINLLTTTNDNHILNTSINTTTVSNTIKGTYLVSTAVTAATIKNGLDDLVTYCNLGTSQAELVSTLLAQLDGTLVNVTDPTGMDSLSTIIKAQLPISNYKLFINGLLELKDLNGGVAPLYKPYNQSTIEVSDTLTELINKIIDAFQSQSNRITTYYSTLGDLVEDVNTWPSSTERTTFITYLQSYGVLSYEAAPEEEEDDDVVVGGGVGIPAGTETKEPAAETKEPAGEPTVEGTLDTLNSGLDDISAETDPAKAQDLAVDLINDTAKTVQDLIESGESVTEVVTALESAAEAALAKVNTETVTATVAEGVATVTFSQAETTALIAMLDTIVKTADTLNENLAKATEDAQIQTVLNIAVETKAGEEVTTSSAQLPATLLTAANDKNIDVIAIDTGVAVISIAPDAIPTSGAASLTLSAGTVNAGTLTTEQKAAAGNNVVYEFKATAGTQNVSTFTKAIDIAIPYTPKAGEDTNKITVFFMNNAGKLENVIGTYNAATKSVSFSTNHFSKFIVKYNDVTFNDIASVAWAKSSIETMASKGIISGMSEGVYSPNLSVTRAEFATLIVKALKLEDATATTTFKDIKPTDWYYSAVVAANKAGIVSGRDANTFDPKGKISREDMAVMVARALKQVKGKTATADAATYLAQFSDKNVIASYALDGAALGVKYEIFSGLPGKTFDPKGIASRAQAAVIINKMFSLQ